MPPSIPNSVSNYYKTIFPARWGFWKGLGVGIIVEVPVISGSLWLSAQWAHGDPRVPFPTLLRFTALFAGVAAVVTAGGIGRLAGDASAAHGRLRTTLNAAGAHAVASLALVLIAALPHRHLPAHITGWTALLGCGCLGGALTGAVIGLVCSGPAPVNLSDVVALARKPGHALHELLDPEDFRLLGTALRDRTGHLLTGMFEPAPPPPKDITASQTAPFDPNATDKPGAKPQQ